MFKEEKRWGVVALLLVSLAIAGCSRTDWGDQKAASINVSDKTLAEAEASAIVGYAAALARRASVSDSNYYPSDGDKPTPAPPKPGPSPNGVCENCDGHNWIGDGQPRTPCPVCNKDGKKPPKGYSMGTPMPPGFESVGESVLESSPPPQSEDEKQAEFDRRLNKSLQPLTDGLNKYLEEEAQAKYLKDKESPFANRQQEAPAEEPKVTEAPEVKAEPPAPTPDPPIPTIVVHRAKMSSTNVDQWLMKGKPEWEKNNQWRIQLKELPATAKRSYFQILDGDGSETFVYEYLTAESLARARASKAAPSPSAPSPKPMKSAQ